MHESATRCRAGVSSTRTIAWFPADQGGTDVNVTVVITTPGADYTALASFGSAQDFGQNLVNSMDRSYELRRGKKPDKPVMVRISLPAFRSDCCPNVLRGV